MKIEKFESFSTERKNDKPRKEKLNISDFSKENRCKAECDRKIIRTDDGPKIVCVSCKRIIN